MLKGEEERLSRSGKEGAGRGRGVCPVRWCSTSGVRLAGEGRSCKEGGNCPVTMMRGESWPWRRGASASSEDISGTSVEPPSLSILAPHRRPIPANLILLPRARYRMLHAEPTTPNVITVSLGSSPTLEPAMPICRRSHAPELAPSPDCSLAC